MDSQLIDAAVTELLDATEALVEAHKSFAKRQGSNASGVSASLVQRQQDSFFRISTLFDELQVRSRSSGVDASAAAATAWIQPFANKSNILTRIKRLLGHAKSNANIIMNSEASRGAAACAAQLVPLCAQPALALLDQLLTVATTLASSGSAGQLRLVQQVHSLVLHGGAAAEVASTLRATDAYAAFTASPQGQQILARAGLDAFCLNTRATAGCSQGPSAGARLALLAVEGFLGQEEGAAAWVSGKRTCDAEADMREFCASGMLPAVAAAIVDFPILEASVCDGALHGLHYAARDATRAVWYVHMVYNRLVKSMRSSSFLASAMSSGSAGAAILGRAELAASLAQVLTHPDVRRLQEATLERLLLHASMADAPGPDLGQGSGGGGKGPTAWWLLREEASQRRLWIPDRGGDGDEEHGGENRDTAGWLEVEHAWVVRASLRVWRDRSLYAAAASSNPAAAATPQVGASAAAVRSGGSGRAAGQPGLLGAGGQGNGSAARPTSPPPALVTAQLAARTAEAMIRLCRGRGLEGAYAPTAGWMFVELLMSDSCMDFADEVSALPAAEARQCLPYWLEAAAWGLALATGAEAARRASGQLSSYFPEMTESNLQALALVHMADALVRLWDNASSGTCQLLDEAARADIDRRLYRAELPVTLDQVLRLTFAAFDAKTLAAEILAVAPNLVGSLLQARMVSLLRPTATEPAPPPQSDGRNGGGSRNEDRGGMDIGLDEPGLIITAAKRCRLLASRLEAALEANAGRSAAQRLQYRELLVSATAVHWALMKALNDTKEIATRLEAERQRAAGTAGHGDSGGASDPWVADADARCVSEAHEAFALGARAACPLAALLAQAAAREAMACVEDRDEAILSSLVSQVGDTLGQLSKWARPLVALPASQLLACQPHRLLSAALALCVAVATGPAPPVRLWLHLGQCATAALVAMAALPHVSHHVRDWLAPPISPLPAQERQPTTGTARVDAGDGVDRGSAGAAAEAAGPAEGEQGAVQSAYACLTVPLRVAVPIMLLCAAPYAAYAMKLLLTALDGESGDGGGRDPGGPGAEADGGLFQRAATALAVRLFGPNPPDGSDLLDEVTRAFSQPSDVWGDGDTPAAVARSPLPPPLELEPSPASALRRVRVCGNPACTNFERAAEWELDLKQCSGCRAVRYCGAECQRAHWRGAHRSECARLAGK